MSNGGQEQDHSTFTAEELRKLKSIKERVARPNPINTNLHLPDMLSEQPFNVDPREGYYSARLDFVPDLFRHLGLEDKYFQDLGGFIKTGTLNPEYIFKYGEQTEKYAEIERFLEDGYASDQGPITEAEDMLRVDEVKREMHDLDTQLLHMSWKDRFQLQLERVIKVPPTQVLDNGDVYLFNLEKIPRDRLEALALAIERTFLFDDDSGTRQDLVILDEAPLERFSLLRGTVPNRQYERLLRRTEKNLFERIQSNQRLPENERFAFSSMQIRSIAIY